MGMLNDVLEVQETESENGANDSILVEMMQAGVHYGHKKSKTNPKMKPYIFGVRSDIELIDLNATLEALDKAVNFLKEIKAKGGMILLVAVQPAARETILRLAEKFNYPYVINRWLGGTLTNFKVIRKRTEYFQQLKKDKEAGTLDKYTKKERLKISENIDKMKILFSGLEALTRLPDAVVVVDINLHDTAVREVRRLKIPVVALVHTDADPTQINYPIPANDNAKSSIDWILKRIESEIEKVQTIPAAVPDNQQEPQSIK
ncbi:MAG: 30S ribosomal protein S2 [Patescibacteria group bacterium]|mgnify:CR=1 FL=1